MGTGPGNASGGASSEAILHKLLSNKDDGTGWGYTLYKEWTYLADSILSNANNVFAYAEPFNPNELLSDYSSSAMPIMDVLVEETPENVYTDMANVLDAIITNYYKTAEGETIIDDYASQLAQDIDVVFDFELYKNTRNLQLIGAYGSSMHGYMINLANTQKIREKNKLLAELRYKERIRQQEIRQRTEAMLLDLYHKMRDRQSHLLDHLKTYYALQIASRTEHIDKQIKMVADINAFDRSKFETVLQLLSAPQGAISHQGTLGPSPGQTILGTALSGAALGGYIGGGVPGALLGAAGGAAAGALTL